MEMLRLKKKAKLAQKGHKLLKEKRDALISEFFSFIDKLKAIRTEMEGKLASAYKSLILAQALSGAAEIERAALASSAAYSIESSTSNIMGVAVFNAFKASGRFIRKNATWSRGCSRSTNGILSLLELGGLILSWKVSEPLPPQKIKRQQKNDRYDG